MPDPWSVVSETPIKKSSTNDPWSVVEETVIGGVEESPSINPPPAPPHGFGPGGEPLIASAPSSKQKTLQYLGDERRAHKKELFTKAWQSLNKPFTITAPDGSPVLDTVERYDGQVWLDDTKLVAKRLTGYSGPGWYSTTKSGQLQRGEDEPVGALTEQVEEIRPGDPGWSEGKGKAGTLVSGGYDAAIKFFGGLPRTILKGSEALYDYYRRKYLKDVLTGKLNTPFGTMDSGYGGEDLSDMVRVGEHFYHRSVADKAEMLETLPHDPRIRSKFIAKNFKDKDTRYRLSVGNPDPELATKMLVQHYRPEDYSVIFNPGYSLLSWSQELARDGVGSFDKLDQAVKEHYEGHAATSTGAEVVKAGIGFPGDIIKFARAPQVAIPTMVIDSFYDGYMASTREGGNPDKALLRGGANTAPLAALMVLPHGQKLAKTVRGAVARKVARGATIGGALAISQHAIDKAFSDDPEMKWLPDRKAITQSLLHMIAFELGMDLHAGLTAKRGQYRGMILEAKDLKRTANELKKNGINLSPEVIQRERMLAKGLVSRGLLEEGKEDEFVKQQLTPPVEPEPVPTQRDIIDNHIDELRGQIEVLRSKMDEAKPGAKKFLEKKMVGLQRAVDALDYWKKNHQVDLSEISSQEEPASVGPQYAPEEVPGVAKVFEGGGELKPGGAYRDIETIYRTIQETPDATQARQVQAGNLREYPGGSTLREAERLLRQPERVPQEAPPVDQGIGPQEVKAEIAPLAPTLGSPKIIGEEFTGDYRAEDIGDLGSQARAGRRSTGLPRESPATLQPSPERRAIHSPRDLPPPALPDRIAPLPGWLFHGSPVEGLTELQPSMGSAEKGNAQYGAATYGAVKPDPTGKFRKSRSGIREVRGPGSIYSYRSNIKAPFDFRERASYTPDEVTKLGLSAKLTDTIDGPSLRYLLMDQAGDPLEFTRHMLKHGYDGFMADYGGEYIFGAYLDGHSSEVKQHFTTEEASAHVKQRHAEQRGARSVTLRSTGEKVEIPTEQAEAHDAIRADIKAKIDEIVTGHDERVKELAEWQPGETLYSSKTGAEFIVRGRGTNGEFTLSGPGGAEWTGSMADGKNFQRKPPITADLFGGQQIYERALKGLGLEPDASVKEIYDASVARVGKLGATVKETAVKLMNKIQGLGREAAQKLAEWLHDFAGGTRKGQTGAINPRLSEVVSGARVSPQPKPVQAPPQLPAKKGQVVEKPWMKSITPEQRASLEKTGGVLVKEPIKDRLKRWQEKAISQRALIDQFAPLKKLGERAYRVARMSKAVDEPLEAFMMYRNLFIEDEIYNTIVGKGSLFDTFAKLEGEHDRFLEWVAANRAERLKTVGAEHLYDKNDIKNLKDLAQGNMGDSPSGKKRSEVYKQVHAELNGAIKNMLDIAEQSGLINKDARKAWEQEWYVPFYRELAEGNNNFARPGGLVKQDIIKKLEGSSKKLKQDKLHSLISNWTYIISASAKNRAARLSLKTAEQQGIAKRIEEPEKCSVWYMENGEKVHYKVNDPEILDALNALEYVGSDNFAMRVMSQFKRVLTVGVTSNPTFKIKNLIRDSIQSIAVSGISPNAFKNVFYTGIPIMADVRSQTRASLLASGGIIRFGSVMEGADSKHLSRLIDLRVPKNTIVGSWEHFRDIVQRGFDIYNEIGDISEGANRAALYKQMRDKGYSHLDAAFAARDLLDFTKSGASPAVRFLAQTVPFFNARLQGLYKLGQGAKENPAKFSATVGAIASASILLMAAYHDDEDWKARADWDRDNNWWFKIGKTAYRIPKPFEVGAIGTIAERGVELFCNDEMTKKQFLNRLAAVLGDNLSMNPIPQVLKPGIELAMNKDIFSGKSIENMGMEKLQKQYRYSEQTSELAKGIGKAGVLSPVQIDHLVRGYLGWLGTMSLAVSNEMIRPFSEEGQRPSRKLSDTFLVGNFAESLPSANSKYVTQVYEQIREIEESFATHRFVGKTMGVKEAKEFLESSPEAWKAETANAIRSELTEISQAIQATMRDKKLSSSQKREKLDLLVTKKNLLAKKALSVLKKPLKQQEEPSE